MVPGKPVKMLIWDPGTMAKAEQDSPRTVLLPALLPHIRLGRPLPKKAQDNATDVPMCLSELVKTAALDNDQSGHFSLSLQVPILGVLLHG
ncbi:MAG: hypothetical protein JSU94_03155 [Phycisphaerales bacterium]|nr:MAG: hypothetical protein JSU94_03155 [Phycisphaerales bacterium]